MGLKEMLDKQRQDKTPKAAPIKPPEVVVSAAPTPEPSKPGGLLGRFKAQSVGSKPSPSVTIRRDANTVVQPSSNLEGKSDEKVTTPAPSAPAVEKAPERAKSDSVVQDGKAGVSRAENSVRNGNGAVQTVGHAVISPTFVGTAATISAGPNEPPAGLEELKRNIAFLSANIDQKELVGQVVRRVLIDLRKNPQFSTHMTDVDFNTITRAFRRSAVVAARKKTEARDTKAKKKAGDNDFADFMAASGMKDFDLGGGEKGGGWS